MAYLYEAVASELPVVQGIELIATHRLPDRLRSVFKHPVFNAVQSKCFNAVFCSNDNFVLSAPTGSGKTAILELAICRLAAQAGFDHHFKVIYQAPTKALCAERQIDWAIRFSHLGLKCAELTGDTDQKELRAVQSADIIITTPEKWDSITRKWKDHAKLLELVKLFLIDEVHILKEDRGATLEAVVSRMRSVAPDIRFVALSASIPNSDDIAMWLGRGEQALHLPAVREVFGEEFRPVKLQKYVVGLKHNGGNDWIFEQACNKRLPGIIMEYGSAKKPIMIFCFTRKSTEETAHLLAQMWSQSSVATRYWHGPRSQVIVSNEKLRKCINTGVAFHHAGLNLADRIAVEKAYLDGDVNVICSTSTLAMGVNLPCHFVIIKNTVSYQSDGLKEYSDLEVIQMLGRAGRPQFDRSAIAVILTRSEKAEHYQSMVSGKQILESRLHENLINHLNAEVGLGTIYSYDSARKWLESTFFFIRFKQNPSHYRLSGSKTNNSLGNVVEHMCSNDLKLLEEHCLITGSETGLKSTELGDAMARYYIHFQTMKLFVSLPPKPKVSDILSVIAQAHEYSSIHFRSKEKSMLREINSSPSIKFPIKVDIALPVHKISLIIQATLAGLDTIHDDRFRDNSLQLQIEGAIIFQHIHRLIRCMVDCQLHLMDSIGARNALELARSLGARAWDDSPLQLQQIDKIGPVSVRKLVAAGIRNMEDLENTASHKIEMILHKGPPFGATLLERLKTFPKLKVSMSLSGYYKTNCTPISRCVRVNVRANLEFLNDKVPTFFMNKAVHVILLAETSDGRKVHFYRASAQKIGSRQDVSFAVDLVNPEQTINCYVSCDDIAGTLKHASLDPKIPTSAFPANAFLPQSQFAIHSSRVESRNKLTNLDAGDNFEDASLDDSDIMAAEDTDFVDIDELDPLKSNPTTSRDMSSSPPKHVRRELPQVSKDTELWQPEKLRNGKWVCNHKCKNKRTCKHSCCREGLDKPPKPSKSSNKEANIVDDEGSKYVSKKVADFFDQSKSTNMKGSTARKNTPQPNLLQRKEATENPRPRSNCTSDSSPTLEGQDFWGLEATQTNYDISSSSARIDDIKARPGKHYNHKHLSDESNPYKETQMARVDLTSGVAGQKRFHELDGDDLEAQSGHALSAMTSKSFEKRQRVSAPMPASHPRPQILKKSEHAMKSVQHFEGENASVPGNVGRRTAEDRQPTRKLSHDFDDDTFSDIDALEISGTPPLKHLGDEALTTAFNANGKTGELLPTNMAIAGATTHDIETSGDSMKYDASFIMDDKDVSRMQNEDAKQASSNRTVLDVIEPWFIEQFGAYVEFI